MSSKRRITPEIHERSIDNGTREKALAIGCGPLLADLMARRVGGDINLDQFMKAQLRSLTNPSKLAGIDKAAERVIRAITNDEQIGVNADYDCDGVSGLSTALSGLVTLGVKTERLTPFIGHRLLEGYGLSSKVAQRILESNPKPSLVITIDHGSSDADRIALLASHGIETIVTDHHEIPVSGLPEHAVEVVNPQRSDCQYGDRAVAGGMVIWLLLCRIQSLNAQKSGVSADFSELTAELDKVACSTVADCVSMGSLNNRAVVKYGLRLMNGRKRPCWEVAAGVLGKEHFVASDIAFSIGPAINSKSRMSTADAGVNFLCANTKGDATTAFMSMQDDNEKRKVVEREMVQVAIDKAGAFIAGGSKCLTLDLGDGHAGVSGICGSRIVERFGRPVFIFARDPNTGDWTGSGRSIAGFNLKEALDTIRELDEGLLIAGGGHAMAAGCKVVKDGLERFRDLFEEMGERMLGNQSLKPVIHTDGVLKVEDLSLATLNDIERLEPTGRGFEAPTFHGEFQIMAIKPVGDGTHLKLDVKFGAKRIKAIWFKALEAASDEPPIAINNTYRLIYSLMENNFRGRSLELKIIGTGELAPAPD